MSYKSPLLQYSKTLSPLQTYFSKNRGNELNTIYRQADDSPIFVEKYNSSGFTIAGGLKTSGSLLLLNGFPFQWNASTRDLSEEKILNAIRVFEVIKPKPEIVLFGMGKEPRPLPKKVVNYLNSLGIQVDVMSTRNASSTYNVLIEEERLVSAALFPPSSGAA